MKPKSNTKESKFLRVVSEPPPGVVCSDLSGCRCRRCLHRTIVRAGMYHTVEECKKTGISLELDMYRGTTPETCPLPPRKARQSNAKVSDAPDSAAPNRK